MSTLEKTLSKYVFGKVPLKPIADLHPAASVKFKLRKNMPAYAFVTQGGVTRQHLLVDTAGRYWELGPGWCPKQFKQESTELRQMAGRLKR